MVTEENRYQQLIKPVVVKSATKTQTKQATRSSALAFGGLGIVAGLLMAASTLSIEKPPMFNHCPDWTEFISRNDGSSYAWEYRVLEATPDECTIQFRTSEIDVYELVLEIAENGYITLTQTLSSGKHQAATHPRVAASNMDEFVAHYNQNIGYFARLKEELFAQALLPLLKQMV